MNDVPVAVGGALVGHAAPIVVIVGTSHTIQTSATALRPFLKNLCRKFNIQAVAEEMSVEGLGRYNSSSSIPMLVAAALQLPHRLCDPDTGQRAALGIRLRGEILLDASSFKSDPPLPPEEVLSLIRESDLKRERYWLDELRRFGRSPVLFVCGADHVASFSQLLDEQGFAVDVAAKDWQEPEKSRRP